jgi:hypothetical protein
VHEAFRGQHNFAEADRKTRGQNLKVSRTKTGLSLELGLLLCAPLVSFTAYPSFASFKQKSAASQSVSMHAKAWNILYSPSMPPHPNAVHGAWYFDFPSCRGTNVCSIHYVTVPVNLSASKLVRAAFQISTTGTPTFQYKLQADNTCEYPAHVRYILQRKGDDLSANSELYRWFSLSGVKLEQMSADLIVPLLPEQWVSVFGKRGDYDESTRNEFHRTLQSLGNVGFVYGGGCFYGHGVNVTGGSARFIATKYSVK